MSILAGFCALLLFSPLGDSGPEKAVPFDSQAALGYIKDLASDSMLGRKSGEAGGIMAEEYLASKLREWGIEPGGIDGTFFQPFCFPYFNLSPGARMEIISDRGRKNFDYEEGWRVWPYSGSGQFTAEIVFVGYGICAPEGNYDDYAGVNIQGKMALLVNETPVNLNQRLGAAVDIENRIRAIQRHGAKGVLICPSPVREGRMIRGSLGDDVYKPDFVIIRIEPSIVEYIFKDLPTDLLSLVQEMDSSSKPSPLATGVTASLEVKTVYDKTRSARNVLGRIPGSDQVLKNECIIVAAHMDHLGIDPRGEVMNGANDNASGTAVALEVARILNQTRSRLKRSVVFFLWAAEEQGYRGLNHYCQHPLYPLEKTVAYLTMDMVGHGNGMVSVSGRDYRPDLWEFLIKRIPENVSRYVEPSERFSPRLPDWEPLLPTGVARLGIQTSGHHLKFHTSRDDVDLIKPRLLERTGNFVKAAVDALAGESDSLIPPFRREDYYLKIVRLVDYQPLPIERFIFNPAEAGNSPANIRLAIPEEPESLFGDALRVDVEKSVLGGLAAVKKNGHISVYSSLARLDEDIVRRRTAIIPGLGSVRTLANDPDWAIALAKMGVRFVCLNSPSAFMSDNAFTEEGKRIWRALEENGIVIMVSGLTPDRQRILVEKAEKPFVLMEHDLPPPELLDLMRAKKSVLALILDEREAVDFFQRLDRARSVLGSNKLMIMNGLPIHEKANLDLMRLLTHEILQAGYAWTDIQNLFSGTFLSLFDSFSTVAGPSREDDRTF